MIHIPWPRLLLKELLREVFLVFTLCLGAVIFLLFLGEVLKLRRLLLGFGLGLHDLGILFFYLIPFFLLLIFPLVCMLALFLTFQRMGADREIMALRAGGVSLISILPAPLLFLSLSLLVHSWISFSGLSWGMSRFQDYLLDVARQKAQLSLQPGMFNQDFPGLTIYAQDVQAGEGLLQRIFVQERSKDGQRIDIVAPQGRLFTDHRVGKIFFVLYNGWLILEDGKTDNILQFGTYKLALDLGKILDKVNLNKDKPQYLSWRDLENRLASKERVNYKSKYLNKLLVERQKRLVLPAASLILGFFALALGWMFATVKRQYGIIVLLLLFLAYYALLSLGISLGETGRLSPRIGLWLPNMMFLMAGACIFALARQEGRMPWLQRMMHLRRRKKKHA